MVAFALALQLVAASPTFAPQPAPDAGLFQGRELAAAGLGVLAGDALVVGLGYATLQLFANDTFSPTAGNFRTAAFALAGAALVLPPLGATVAARLVRVSPAAGAFWKALLLASLGHAAALGAGYLAAPRFWVVIPVQLAGVAAGSSLGLHWGPRARPAVRQDPGGRATPTDPARPAKDAVAVALYPMCPDR
ncbi:hypothetical protein [Anaeromyxobacter terrae]|uniref:hypothetical protein n=1 Tax=Anaeromyxobacter terrae TaxID=2925406 RepID=UPI001F5AE6C3|nr:hypothetical protein [Anaeromyxobacter sp. SG22]